ncbi:MAG: hypothetical protein JW939_00600 [Candidatus Thermoplasmatota archaeon]|nr:hypothetical protein [Candidatus Thermoplasmatota archaeon]
MTEECQDILFDTSGPISRGKDFGSRKLELISLIEGRREGADNDTSSATLVRTPTTTVVIDTGSAGAREELMASIAGIDLNVEKVNVMVATRIDPLFNGNDDIFVNALQHLRKDEWSLVPPGPRRKIAIKDRFHWIDRYLRLEVVNDPAPGNLVLILHIPCREELLSRSAIKYAGMTIGISGPCISSENDPEVAETLKTIRKKRKTGAKRKVQHLRGRCELLEYCDYIVPAFGPMFKVIP